MNTTTIQPDGPLQGSIRVPGDKSISHRSLLFSAIAKGRSTIRGISNGDDVVRTRLALEAMGAEFEKTPDGFTINGGRSLMHAPAGELDLGNAGTAIRLMTGWTASMPWESTLTGDASLCKRDMWRVVEPLRQMGAEVNGQDGGRFAPLVVRGGNLQGIHYQSLPGTAQPKSAVMIAGLVAAGETEIYESVPARAHTEEMLAEFGADIDTHTNPDRTVTTRLRPSGLDAFEIDIPGDPSQATYWAVAACIVPGSNVTIENVYVGPHRAGAFAALKRMGADIEIKHRTGTSADIIVRSSGLTGIEIAGEEIPSLIDELPVLAVAASFANGTTTVRDAVELRTKESDRVTSVVSQLGGIGAQLEERPDGFVVHGIDRPLTGGTIETHLDHRIAMMGAIAALASSNPVTINGWETVGTSYPAFLDDLAKLRG